MATVSAWAKATLHRSARNVIVSIFFISFKFLGLYVSMPAAFLLRRAMARLYNGCGVSVETQNFASVHMALSLFANYIVNSFASFKFSNRNS